MRYIVILKYDGEGYAQEGDLLRVARHKGICEIDKQARREIDKIRGDFPYFGYMIVGDTRFKEVVQDFRYYPENPYETGNEDGAA